MALTLNNAILFNAGNFANSPAAEYRITQTGGPDNLSDLATAIGAHADWTVTSVVGTTRRYYTIAYTGTNVNRTNVINVCADITDNRAGQTVFHFTNADNDTNGSSRVFFQLMGQGRLGSTAPAANINIGLADAKGGR